MWTPITDIEAAEYTFKLLNAVYYLLIDNMGCRFQNESVIITLLILVIDFTETVINGLVTGD